MKISNILNPKCYIIRVNSAGKIVTISIDDLLSVNKSRYMLSQRNIHKPPKQQRNFCTWKLVNNNFFAKIS